jgi:acyl-coenzyme A thioesterase PaaI-like protein
LILLIGIEDERGKTTKAVATIVKHGRRIANVRVVAWQDDPEKPVAAGIGNFLV